VEQSLEEGKRREGRRMRREGEGWKGELGGDESEQKRREARRVRRVGERSKEEQILYLYELCSLIDRVQ
jgi:hypothetical protein